MKLRFYHVLLASPILFIWIWTWLYLASEWSVNEQYQFGFAVPLLALFLAWQNWPASLSAGTKSWIVFYVLAWPVLLLAEMLRLTDPLWRLTGGIWMLGSTLLTIGYLAQVGGWALVRRMLFPLGFLWTGLPWPVPLENQVIQTFARGIAATTVTLMNIAGIAALQRGNTVELANQVVGVEAACTGIESFQASLMVSLFLWALMRLRWSAGLVLVLAGMVCSLLINLCRVFVLTWSAHSLSQENQVMHDWVGLVATVFIFGTVLLIARWLRGKHSARAVEQPVQEMLSPSEKRALRWYRTALFSIVFLSIPRIGSLNSTPHEQTAALGQPRWQVDSGNVPAGWSSHTWNPTSEQRSALRFSQWSACQVRTSDGLWANIVHLFWGTDHAIPSTAFYHTPALCMPSAGWQVIRDPELLELVAYGQPVPFVSYLLGKDLDRVLVLQYLSRGQHQDPFLVESILDQRSLDRLKYLWGRAREPVNEEILIYLPDLGSDLSDTRFANEIFLQLVKPVAPR
jgi:exosortase